MNKGAYATTDGLDAFGKAFATKGLEQVGLHQADRYHVNMRIWQIAHGEKDLSSTTRAKS